MPMIQASENYALVEIEKKFQDERGGILIDPTWLPEEHATLEGTVITAPIRTVSDTHRTIIGNVQPGDRIFFSYAVVFDLGEQPEDDTPVYRNLILFENKEYWRVPVGEIFCKIQGPEMITDNILIDPVTTTEGYVIAAPPDAGCQPKDLVCFEQRFVQEYNIFGKIHYILPTRKLLAKAS